MTENNYDAGVHAAMGFEFQKHCALYLLFEEYNELKEKNYYFCFEHSDDFVLCEMKENKIVKIRNFQAKKSEVAWTMSDEFIVMLIKMFKSVRDNINKVDSTSRESVESYSTFLTNDKIEFYNGNSKKKEKLTIKSSNNYIGYAGLQESIKNRIEKDIIKHKLSDCKENFAYCNQRDNIFFKYIDLNKTAKLQRATLIGIITELFGDEIKDSSAAFDTLMRLFRDSELTFNQGGIIDFYDNSKIVDSVSIENAINLITTKSIAYEWIRNKGDAISEVLDINVREQKKFIIEFNNTIDRLKDPTQSMVNNVYCFVKENSDAVYTKSKDIECIEQLLRLYEKKHNSRIENLQLKAILTAAYFVIKEEE